MKKVFKNIPERKIRWKTKKEMVGQFRKNLKKSGVRSWGKIAMDRDIWKLIVRDARVLQGLYSRERRREKLS
jgi:hypothetical protein